MAALTAQQTAFFEQLEVSFDAFVAKLTEATEVDNDPNTVLSQTRPLRLELQAAAADLVTRLGSSAQGPYKVKLPPGIHGVFESVNRVDFAIDRGPLTYNVPSE